MKDIIERIAELREAGLDRQEVYENLIVELQAEQRQRQRAKIAELQDELELHRDYESFLQGRDHSLPMPSYTSWKDSVQEVIDKKAVKP